MLPGYVIAAGSAAGEGVVLTRNASGDDTDEWPLSVPPSWASTAQSDGWFRLQTNYDHWGPAPKSDDRRDPGIKAMRTLERRPTFEGLWEVLGTHPVYNPSTIHTDLVFPATGDYRSYVRNYPRTASAR